MSKGPIKIKLQYKDRTTSVELDTSCSVKSMRPFLKALWEAMDDSP